MTIESTSEKRSPLRRTKDLWTKVRKSKKKLIAVATLIGTERKQNERKLSQFCQSHLEAGKYDSIHDAAYNGDSHAVRAILKNGLGSVTQLSEFRKRSALHWAVRGGWVNTINVLLEEGADVDLVDGMGFSALDLAKRYQFPLAVKAIEKHIKQKR
eukprot:g3131.t1